MAMRIDGCPMRTFGMKQTVQSNRLGAGKRQVGVPQTFHIVDI